MSMLLSPVVRFWPARQPSADVVAAGGVVTSALSPELCYRCQSYCDSAYQSIGGVALPPAGVGYESALFPVGGVVVSPVVLLTRAALAQWRCCTWPVVLLSKCANNRLAVLQLPLVLPKSAPRPMAVFSPPSMLLYKRRKRRSAVLSLPIVLKVECLPADSAVLLTPTIKAVQL